MGWMTQEEASERYKAITESIIQDPKMIMNTLQHYFGGADALWHAVHLHITDLVEMDLMHGEDIDENIRDLEQARDKALQDIAEQELLVND